MNRASIEESAKQDFLQKLSIKMIVWSKALKNTGEEVQF